MINNKKKIIICVIIAVITLLLIWIFRPTPSYDIKKVDKELQNIVFPLKAIAYYTYLDGGSIALFIIDHKNNILKFAIPAGMPGYRKIYIGVFNTEDGGRLLENQLESKKMLFSILDNSNTVNHARNIALLAKWRERWKDYIGVYYHHYIKGDYNRNFNSQIKLIEYLEQHGEMSKETAREEINTMKKTGTE
jgi:hypothetical protein